MYILKNAWKSISRSTMMRDFYYTGTTTVNADDNLEAVDTTGIEDSEESNESQSKNGMGGFSTATDSVNQIYISYNALAGIMEAFSATAAATEEEDEDAEVTALVNQVSGKPFYSSPVVSVLHHFVPLSTM